jgi:hypothetical protein
MSHVNKLQEASRTAKESGFATLGRALADASAAGNSIDHLVLDAVNRRTSELEVTDRAAIFASLTRQIGDAARAGNPIEVLMMKLRELRRAELR